MAIVWRTLDVHLLEPQFYFDVNKLLEDSPYTWFVTEAFRSKERSNKLYDEYMFGVIKADGTRGPKGPRAAPAGKSAHNYGLAIDVALDKDNDSSNGLQMIWDTSVPGWLWLKAKTLIHPRLKGGWKFGDWPHIEKYQWENYKNWLGVTGG
jgi:hypothetical protein